MIYDIYLNMIKKSYDNKNIEELRSIKTVLSMMPLKYFTETDISIIKAQELIDLINEDIEMLK